MPLEFSFTCSLPDGVHARPASALKDSAGRFASTIFILNARTGETANAKSVLAIVGIDIRSGDHCRVTLTGPDEREACAALNQFLERDFPRYDAPLPPIQAPMGEVRLPHVLKRTKTRVLGGIPAAPGIAQGRAVKVGGFMVPDSIPRQGVKDVEAEIRLLNDALQRLAENYDLQIARLGSGIESDMLEAHRSVSRDPEFQQRLEGAVRRQGCTAAGAVAEAERHFTTLLIGTGSLLLRERAQDVRDVCVQLLRQIYGEAVELGTVRLAGDSICFAEDLTPEQFLALDRRYLKGLVLAHAGTTSHVVILARSFGIPTLVGVGGLEGVLLAGVEVIVDADLGGLIVEITENARRYYDLERRCVQSRRSRLHRFAQLPAGTRDGHRIEVTANISTSAEAARAFAEGAEGIGLFRTEMLFINRKQAPTEGEQLEEYRRVLMEASGKSVIIRTLDVGGDKPIPYLDLPKEENPFLGYRAVRVYREFENLFRDQVRAIVKASSSGRLRLMIPMVSDPEEAVWVRKIVNEEQARCEEAGITFDSGMKIGAMVEVPACAFILDRLCCELDFFSIGTNDLLQYFMAVDRAHGKIGYLYNPLNPAFLRLLRKIVDEIHDRRKWVGVCGEMAGQMRCLPILVGLGVDEISMTSAGIAEAKSELAEINFDACQALAAEAVDCQSLREVELLLDRFDEQRPLPLIDPELIVFGGTGSSKEEAIKEIVDRLYVVGRTERPRDVEDALWQRESAYSTGFGHGFAIPHCRTNAVKANSLAILKLNTPVEWGSCDEKPVQVVILLIIREGAQEEEHMRILASLARLLMHEEFRGRLASEQDPEALCRFLIDSVGS